MASCVAVPALVLRKTECLSEYTASGAPLLRTMRSTIRAYPRMHSRGMKQPASTSVVASSTARWSTRASPSPNQS